MKCDTCSFWVYDEKEGLSSDGTKTGECRRYPPDQYGNFGESQHHHFCGEHKEVNRSNDIDKMSIKIVKKLKDNGGSMTRKDLRDKTKSRCKTLRAFEIAIGQLTVDSVIVVQQELAKNNAKHDIVCLIEGQHR